MIHHTREELWDLYNEAGSVPDVAGISLVLRYLRTMLLTPFDDNELDSSDNIYEKFKYKAENPSTYTDTIGLSGIPTMGQRVDVPEFYKRLIFDIPLEDMPLFVEGPLPARMVAAWRLRIGK